MFLVARFGDKFGCFPDSGLAWWALTHGVSVARFGEKVFFQANDIGPYGTQRESDRTDQNHATFCLVNRLRVVWPCGSASRIMPRPSRATS